MPHVTDATPLLRVLMLILSLTSPSLRTTNLLLVNFQCVSIVHLKL